MLRGLLAGGITLGVAAVFPEELVLPFFAVALGLAGGVCPGLAMARSQEGQPFLQWLVAAALVALAMAGLWASPLLLAGGWGLHALWVLLHGAGPLRGEAPEGLPSFFFAFDLVLGGFVVYMWAVLP